MKMFVLKFLLIASLMFISVLFGMQQANEGIHRMRGFEDEEFKAALNVNENDEGEIEVSLLGNDIDSHDLEKKRKKLEEMKAYNFFSSMGKKISEAFSTATQKIIEFVAYFFNK